MKDEFGWLIETNVNGYAEWLGIDNYSRWFWTTDSNEALRFGREVDAQTMMKKLSVSTFRSEIMKATSHMWMGDECI